MLASVHGSAPDTAAGRTGDLFGDVGEWFDQNLIEPLSYTASHGFRATENARGLEGITEDFDAFGGWIGGAAADVARVVGPVWDAVASPLGDALFAGVTFIPGLGTVVGGVVGAIRGLAANGFEGMAEEALLGALPAGAGMAIRAAGGLKTLGALAKGDLEGAAASAAGAAIKTYLPAVQGFAGDQAKAILGSLSLQVGPETVADLLPDVDLGHLEGMADMVASNIRITIPTAAQYQAAIESGLRSSSTPGASGGPFDGMTFEQATTFRANGGKLSASAEGAFYTEAMNRAGNAAFAESARQQSATWSTFQADQARAQAAADAIPAGGDPIVADGMTFRQATAFRAAGGIMSQEAQAAWFTAAQQAAAGAAQKAAAAAQSAMWAEVNPGIQAAIAAANRTPPGPGPIVDNGWTLAQVRAYYDAGGRITEPMRSALMRAASAATSASRQTAVAATAPKARAQLEIGATVAPGAAAVASEPEWPEWMTFDQAIDAWETYLNG